MNETLNRPRPRNRGGSDRGRRRRGRVIAGDEVEDGEAAHGEADMVVDEEAVATGYLQYMAFSCATLGNSG